MKDNQHRIAVPREWQDVFASIVEFNEMQSECLEEILHADRNLVISSPIGSGKTVLCELAILRVTRISGDIGKKALYLAPTKASLNEKKIKWEKCFGKQVIAYTPESFLSQFGDVNKLMDLDLALIMIDEIHLLSNEIRGPHLEMIIVRLKKYFPNARFIAIDANILNLSDLSIFFKQFDGVPAKTKKFSQERFKKRNLDLKVLGYPSFGNNPFLFESSLDKKLLQVLDQYPKGTPTLIFCSTKKSCEKAAKILAKSGRFSSDKKDNDFHLSEPDLNILVKNGVAYHHSGVFPGDRTKIESLFSGGTISVIACTSTLATGIHLPASLIIIKSTNQYDLKEKRYVEYPLKDLKQMIGRLGGNCGTAIIMTEDSKTLKFQSISLNEEILIESCLELFIEEIIIEEMSNSTLITNKGSLIEWFKETLLFVRYPNFDIIQIFERIKDAFLDCESKGKYKVNPEVRIILKHKIPLNAFKAISEGLKNPQGNQSDFLWALSSVLTQFPGQRINFGDKKIMRRLSPLVKYPSNGNETISKNFLFIQMILGGLEDQVGASLSIKNEAISIVSITCKIIDAIVEIHLNRSLIPQNIYFAIELQMALKCNCWPTGASCMQRQIKGLGHAYSGILADHGINSIEKLKKEDPRRIEVLLKRQPPFGNQILNQLDHFPEIIKNETDLVVVNSKGNAYWVFKIDGAVRNLKDNDSFRVKEILGIFFENFTIFYKSNEIIGIKMKSNNASTNQEKFGQPLISEKEFLPPESPLNEQLIIKVDRPEKMPSNIEIRKRKKESGNILCNHNCRNKVKCRHACCKKALDSIISVAGKDALEIEHSLPKDIDSTLEWLSHYRFPPLMERPEEENEYRLIFS